MARVVRTYTIVVNQAKLGMRSVACQISSGMVRLHLGSIPSYVQGPTAQPAPSRGSRQNSSGVCAIALSRLYT